MSMVCHLLLQETPRNIRSFLQLSQFCRICDQLSQFHCVLITTGLLYRSKDPFLWNTLIHAYTLQQCSKNPFILFTQMLKNQIHPDKFTFPSLIKASSTSKPIGRTIHGLIIKHGLPSDDFIHSCLIQFYGIFAETDDARQVFVQISEPDKVSHNAMLDAYCKNGKMASARQLFVEMPWRDVVSWTTMVNGCAKNGHCREAFDFFKSMVDMGLSPHEATLVSVISACGSLGAANEGKSVHGYVIRRSIMITPFLGTSLIDMYGKCGFLNSAIIVFGSMQLKQLCTWNAMITTFAAHDCGNEAMSTYNDMLKAGLEPNGITFVGVLTACARAGCVELGIKYFDSMHKEFNISPWTEHYSCMVNLLGAAGLLQEASEFIRRMPVDVEGSVWGALLGACRLHGELGLAESAGQRLLGLEPERSGAYVVFSNIYSGCGRWQEAVELREVMADKGVKKLAGCSWVSTTPTS
ncbi:putative pentatricopeptide repeat-containing protein At1g10330 [Nymphaea colorata]|nr:putative pentatricopeptide repeat-containing protein At1g10330 [Nymphaea colorata]XP_031475689.1 putative pentatricopeptide repeat-containing protein At1g10330 [Nymphaea colorata]XP_031475692.1 putative pentatricopeptide repeat-containing protein At1g10330 [Nymphaea colorata]XP_031475693.1 putative pentatricopeptide repeat-containing protein At1g10330 [Nymphaea colorata]XP_031475695.1 putative pentatricopeptide repeat-containing protein At1g10330 [Nymphaea colorata]XP_031475698.1 putative p